MKPLITQEDLFKAQPNGLEIYDAIDYIALYAEKENYKAWKAGLKEIAQGWNEIAHRLNECIRQLAFRTLTPSASKEIEKQENS